MAQGEGFKHITVMAAEDEDVVIYAGLGEADEAPEAAIVEAEVEEAEAPADSAANEKAAEGDLHTAAEDALHAPAEGGTSQPAGDSKPHLQSKPARKDSYRETTLEDLQDHSMPIAQRIVIIAAIVCIIGAVIYYFAFMR